MLACLTAMNCPVGNHNHKVSTGQHGMMKGDVSQIQKRKHTRGGGLEGVFEKTQQHRVILSQPDANITGSNYWVLAQTETGAADGFLAYTLGGAG